MPLPRRSSFARSALPEEHIVSIGESQIPVTIQRPEGVHRSHIVMGCYGGSRTFSRKQLALLMGPLVGIGYTIALFDYRGMVAEAKLAFEESGLATRIEDAKAVLRFIRDRYAGFSISVLGISMGGYVASHLVGETPLRSVTLLAPAAYHPNAVEHRIPFTDAFTRFLRDETRYPWVKSDAFSRMTEHRGSFLLIEYGRDQVIPHGVGERYFHATSGLRDRTRVLLPKFRHDGTFDESPAAQQKRSAVLGRVVPWFIGL